MSQASHGRKWRATAKTFTSGDLGWGTGGHSLCNVLRLKNFRSVITTKIEVLGMDAKRR